MMIVFTSLFMGFDCVSCEENLISGGYVFYFQCSFFSKKKKELLLSIVWIVAGLRLCRADDVNGATHQPS